MRGFVDGAALLLGALLLSSGSLKLWQPAAFVQAVRRLLPGSPAPRERLARLAAPAVGSTEVLVGGALIGASWWPAAVAAGAVACGTALYTAFVGVVVVAIRKGTACGCWSSFSDGPAGGAELGRALALAALAWAAAAGLLAGAPGRGWAWSAVAWAAGSALLVAAAVIAGGRSWRPAQPAAPGARAGRAAAVAFMLGRVTSRRGQSDLPTSRVRSPRARRRAIAGARSTGAWREFELWLGGRAAAIDWRAATVRRSAVRGPQGRTHFVEVAPSPPGSVGFSISFKVLAGRPADGFLVGSVDGTVVTSSAGGVVAHGPVVRAGSPAEGDG